VVVTQGGGPVGGVGVTAVLVAGARAAESGRADRLFEDAFAGAFVEAASAGSASMARELGHGSPDEAVNEARRNSIAVRTRFFDDYLMAATGGGRRQVVLLAAGLDARAFRLGWPEGIRLWELDLPEVFAFKEQVLGGLDARAGCERSVVAVDLREDWPRALRAAGFDLGAPTAWLVEGLLMYLDEGERDLLLERVGALSSPRSRLALDHAPGFFARPTVTSSDDPRGEEAAARFAALAAAAASDASLVEPAAWLGRHGWRAEVEAPAALLERYGRPVPEQLQQQGAAGTPRSWIAMAERG
jgi:methyltransferase (TIGR00027 family)